MSLIKAATILLVVLLVFPFGYAFLAPDGKFFLIPAEPTFRSAASNIAFWLYVIPTYAVSAFLIVKSEVFSKRAKTLWLVFTFFVFPIAIWIMLGRMNLHRPSQVPKDLEDQRRILRENVARIKAERK